MKIKVVACKKCGSYATNRAGMVKGNQRYKCKDCGCQFQPNRKSGKPESTKRLAILLYLSGLSFRSIAKIVKSDVHAVYRWVRKFAEENYEKPTPNGSAVVVELDEMWHFINNKKTNSGFGRLIVALPVSSLTGNVGIVVRKSSKSCSTDCNG